MNGRERSRYYADNRDDGGPLTFSPFLAHDYPLALVQVHSDLFPCRKTEHGPIVISYNAGRTRDRRQIDVGT
jgi:hypothetical protein